MTNAPSRLWYVLAVAVFIGGFAGMIMFIVPRIASATDAMTQVLVPGERVVALAEPGSYMIFHERQSVLDGKVYSVLDVSGLGVEVESMDSGEVIALEPTSNGTRYAYGGRKGWSIFRFEIPKAGDYRIRASYESGADQPQTVLAVGQGFLSGLFITIFGALGLAFAGVGGALAIGLTTYFRRRRARTRCARARSVSPGRCARSRPVRTRGTGLALPAEHETSVPS